MKKAIITGSTGLVGSSVAKYLSSVGVQLLCLGRKELSPQQVIDNFGDDSFYLPLQMRDISLLPREAEALGWESSSNTVFYNFGWIGQKKLTDGKFCDQLNNAVFASDAVKVAKEMGCTKFINSGSMEETFLEKFLESDRIQPYESQQTFYGLAKLACRDICKMISYLELIDYVHTRMSVPLSLRHYKSAYIPMTIKKILKGESYDQPKSNLLYDLVMIDDVARAYYLIGLLGKNKADYFIGRGKPALLREHFHDFALLMNGDKSIDLKCISSVFNSIFDTDPLRRDTGFIASHKLEKLASELL